MGKIYTKDRRKIMNFLTDLFTNKNNTAKVGLSQFKTVTIPAKKENVSIRTKNVKLSDLMRRVS